jgi:hypothetical protein
MTQQTILVGDEAAPMRKLLSGNLGANDHAFRAATGGTAVLMQQ